MIYILPMLQFSNIHNLFEIDIIEVEREISCPTFLSGDLKMNLLLLLSTSSKVKLNTILDVFEVENDFKIGWLSDDVHRTSRGSLHFLLVGVLILTPTCVLYNVIAYNFNLEN